MKKAYRNYVLLNMVSNYICNPSRESTLDSGRFEDDDIIHLLFFFCVFFLHLDIDSNRYEIIILCFGGQTVTQMLHVW